VEKWGEDFGRHPVGVGPYKFVEWKTGEKIVIERNPDFSWEPGYTRGGAPYIETIEFVFLPDHGTIAAGLEAGEIDWVILDPRNVERIRETGRFHILECLRQSVTFMYMNVEKPPFDDIRVRRALNLAVPKDALIEIATGGKAIPAYGPISPATFGYWPGVEYVGYDYDPEAARALMEEAGYTLGSDGIWQKDGARLAFTLKVGSALPTDIKTAELLQQMYKEFGMELEIQLLEDAAQSADMTGGDYELAIDSMGWPEAVIMWVMFHSNFIGMLNDSRVDDPDLNKILEAVLMTVDHEEREKWVNEAQRYIVEKAYVVPLMVERNYFAVNNRVKDVVFSQITQSPQFFDAYIETTSK
jgi:peptide/nickel transport system substrate-binding protein